MTKQEIMALTDNELDYAVAVAQGWRISKDGLVWFIENEKWRRNYHPSTDGSQLLEIMVRELISVTPCAPNLWEAEKVYGQEKGDYGMQDVFYLATGKTPNEAILRCYLLSKQGG